MSVVGTQFFVSIRKQIWFRFCGNDFWRFSLYNLNPFCHIKCQIPHRSGQLQALKFEINYYFLLHYRSISICDSTFHVFPFHSARPKKHRGNSVTAFSRILKQFPGILLNCRNELAFNLTPAQQ